jgi:hypothetical protein
MKSHTKRYRAALAAAVALPLFAWLAAGVQAQTIAPHPATPMARPPASAPDATQATNPDNPDHMPVKKPKIPTDDRMMRSDPASDAKAK